MILADKIIEERKKLGWSQEELAEKLDVSRQSISKWESAQSIPDISRILKMAQLFGVSTDYLLKDDAVREKEPAVVEKVSESVRSVRSVSMEEASAFLAIREKQAPLVAFSVSLCILSAVPLLLLAAASSCSGSGISKNTAGVAGCAILLIMVAIAVFFFIRCSSETKKYEYLGKVEIETEYGVDGMTREKSAGFEKIRTRAVAIGVVLCILSAVPLILSTAILESEALETAMVGLLLVFIATAVYLFVSTGFIVESYDMLLQEGDYTVNKKKNAPVISRISAIYWLAAVALYLAVSLLNESWETSWILWPVAAVLFCIVIIVTKMIIKMEE